MMKDNALLLDMRCLTMLKRKKISMNNSALGARVHAQNSKNMIYTY